MFIGWSAARPVFKLILIKNSKQLCRHLKTKLITWYLQYVTHNATQLKLLPYRKVSRFPHRSKAKNPLKARVHYAQCLPSCSSSLLPQNLDRGTEDGKEPVPFLPSLQTEKHKIVKVCETIELDNELLPIVGLVVGGWWLRLLGQDTELGAWQLLHWCVCVCCVCERLNEKQYKTF